MICAYCNAAREANTAPCPRCGAPSPLLGQTNAGGFQAGSMPGGSAWGMGSPAAGGAANGAWDDVPQLSFSGPQVVPQPQWWSQSEQGQGASQVNWQQGQPQNAMPMPGSGPLGSGQWGSGQYGGAGGPGTQHSWNQDGEANNQFPGSQPEQSLLPVPYQAPNTVQLQVQHGQGTSSLLMPVQNIEQLLPDLPEQEGSVYVPPMYTKPRAVIPRYRIISGFLSVIVVVLLLCGGAGYYAKASGKLGTLATILGVKTPVPVQPTVTTNIPDPGARETGPGAGIITSATTTSRIDPNSHIALDEHKVFAPGTMFYVTYNISTKKDAGKIAVKVFTNGIQDKQQETPIEANQNKHGYISLTYPVSLSGKIELYWNDQLAYRLYFAVR